MAIRSSIWRRNFVSVKNTGAIVWSSEVDLSITIAKRTFSGIQVLADTIFYIDHVTCNMYFYHFPKIFNGQNDYLLRIWVSDYSVLYFAAPFWFIIFITLTSKRPFDDLLEMHLKYKFWMKFLHAKKKKADGLLPMLIYFQIALFFV